MAVVARLQGRNNRPDSASCRHVAQQSKLPPYACYGLEPSRSRRYGTASLPLFVPVLCSQRQTLTSALPAFGRHISRRAVQHRFLRAAAAVDGAGYRVRSRRLHTHNRRHTLVPEPPGTSKAAAYTHATPTAENENKSGREKHLRIQIRRLRTDRLQPISAHSSRSIGINHTKGHNEHEDKHHSSSGKKPRHRLQRRHGLLHQRRPAQVQTAHHRAHRHHGAAHIPFASERRIAQSQKHRTEPHRDQFPRLRCLHLAQRSPETHSRQRRSLHHRRSKPLQRRSGGCQPTVSDRNRCRSAPRRRLLPRIRRRNMADRNQGRTTRNCRHPSLHLCRLCKEKQNRQ